MEIIAPAPHHHRHGTATQQLCGRPGLVYREAHPITQISQRPGKQKLDVK